jgi:cyclophilin family peptidyl-prolyl cis-trans isomerase
MANRRSKRSQQRHGPSTGAARQPDAKPTGARPPAAGPSRAGAGAPPRPTGPGGGRLRTRRAAPPPRRGLFGNQRFLVGYIIFAVLVIAGVTIYTNFINPPQNNPAAGATPAITAPPAAASTSAAIAPVAKKKYDKAPDMTIDTKKAYSATLDTSKGTIKLDVTPSDGPIAANNFIFLAKDGFYDGLTFHRVEDWVIQGGDPSGNGTGGPGYTIKDEPVTKDYKPGVLAMAKTSAPDSAGSQFFIMKKDTPLPKQYTIFGQVTEGQDVVDKIAVGDKINKVTVEEKAG